MATKVEKKFVFVTNHHRTGKQYETKPMTVTEAINYFFYDLECGKSYEHEKGNKKINMNPKTVKSLITSLNNAVNNAAADGYGRKDYSAVEVAG